MCCELVEQQLETHVFGFGFGFILLFIFHTTRARFSLIG